jgi:nucleoside-diphosphate kinase
MNGDYTFSIIKPDALSTGKAGPILTMINEAGFEIAAMKLTRMTLQHAESFYSVHKGKPFFNNLVELMTSGPVIVMILRHNDAVVNFRRLIGSTDPAKAEPGTIRKKFASSITKNAVHGSDSDENAFRESNFFFSETERFL